jgi:hypothetical protein
MFNFEKLEVRHKAIDFADQVYLVTRSFPDNERFGLTNQMRRAAVSVSSNIAEGSSRSSKSDFIRFIKSLRARFLKSFRKPPLPSGNGFLSEETFSKLYTQAEEQSKMLSGLKKSLNSQLSTLD